MDIRVADTDADAAMYSAALVAEWLRGAIDRRGRAAVAFSGGSTPAAMLECLGSLDVLWQAVQVFQVDERCVPDHDPARNAHLLDRLGVPRENLHLMPVTDPDRAAACERHALELPDRFDVVHLGLGDDGHTASWPPGDGVVDVDADVALSGEYRGAVRMTLTPRVVNRARRRLVLAVGESKAAAVSRWLLDDDSQPVARLRRNDTVIVLDRAAASGLPPQG
jgi:6-phosphogluconolactonase